MLGPGSHAVWSWMGLQVPLETELSTGSSSSSSSYPPEPPPGTARCWDSAFVGIGTKVTTCTFTRCLVLYEITGDVALRLRHETDGCTVTSSQVGHIYRSVAKHIQAMKFFSGKPIAPFRRPSWNGKGISSETLWIRLPPSLDLYWWIDQRLNAMGQTRETDGHSHVIGNKSLQWRFSGTIAPVDSLLATYRYCKCFCSSDSMMNDACGIARIAKGARESLQKHSPLWTNFVELTNVQKGEGFATARENPTGSVVASKTVFTSVGSQRSLRLP
jgi:hypothetical protein